MPSASGIPAQPVAVPDLVCPRCKIIFRDFFAIDGQTQFRCSGCEWQFTFGTQAPTGVSNAGITAGVTTAIPMASGGAAFTLGMTLFLDTGVNTEVVVVQSGGTGTSVPVAYIEQESVGVGFSVAGFQKNHLTAMAFGQLSIVPAFTTAQRIPAAPGYGF